MKRDGSVRTPIWLAGEHVTPDQYVLGEGHQQAHEIRHAHLGARQARHAFL